MNVRDRRPAHEVFGLPLTAPMRPPAPRQPRHRPLHHSAVTARATRTLEARPAFRRAMPRAPQPISAGGRGRGPGPPPGPGSAAPTGGRPSAARRRTFERCSWPRRPSARGSSMNRRPGRRRSPPSAGRALVRRRVPAAARPHGHVGPRLRVGGRVHPAGPRKPARIARRSDASFFVIV